jgi:hypothetical protein
MSFQQKKKSKNKNPSYLPVYIAAVIALASLIAMTAVIFYSNENTAKGNFIPPDFESTALSGMPDVPENSGYGRLYREGMGFSAWVCGNVKLQGNEAAVYLTNPAENVVWMKLRIFDEAGNIIGETGLIRPGEYVKSAKLTKEIGVGTAVKMKIMTYEPYTYYSTGAVTLSAVIG